MAGSELAGTGSGQAVLVAQVQEVALRSAVGDSRVDSVGSQDAPQPVASPSAAKSLVAVSCYRGDGGNDSGSDLERRALHCHLHRPAEGLLGLAPRGIGVELVGDVDEDQALRSAHARLVARLPRS